MKTPQGVLEIVMLVCAFSLFLPVRHSAHASQEGMLRWSSFSIESPGIGGSGPVTVSGKQDATGPTTFTIKAFGRKFGLEQVHLAKLKGMTMNGMLLTYERGYRELGGRTLYVKLLSGFTSGVRESRTVTIRERGDIEVSAPP